MPAVNVTGHTVLDGWREGVRAIGAGGGSVHHLFTTIDAPSYLDDAWLGAFSPRKKVGVGEDIRDVVNTIFPVRLAERCVRRTDLYESYMTRHNRARHWRRNRSAWGTYFQRLVCFPPDGVNQLERAIDKLCTWKVRNTTGLVFHLSSPTIDGPRTRGGPCWHFAELLWKADDSIDLVAVYRNHDFFNKALGNFIGLGQLLRFICEASGKDAGKLACHSVHAYSERGIARLNALAA